MSGMLLSKSLKNFIPGDCLGGGFLWVGCCLLRDVLLWVGELSAQGCILVGRWLPAQGSILWGRLQSAFGCIPMGRWLSMGVVSLWLSWGHMYTQVPFWNSFFKPYFIIQGCCGKVFFFFIFIITLHDGWGHVVKVQAFLSQSVEQGFCCSSCQGQWGSRCCTSLGT